MYRYLRSSGAARSIADTLARKCCVLFCSMSIQHAVRSFDEIKDILFLGLDASIHLQTHDLPLGSVIWFLLWYGISRDMTLQIAEKLARVVLLLRPLVFLPGKAQVSYKSAAPSLFTSAVAAEGLCRRSIARDKHWTRAIFAAFPQRWADGLRGLNSEGLLELTHAGARLYAGKAPPGIGACCYILCSRSHFYVGRTAVMRAARPVPGPVARCLEHMAMLIRPPASKKRASVYLLLSRSNIDHICFFSGLLGCIRRHDSARDGPHTDAAPAVQR